MHLYITEKFKVTTLKDRAEIRANEEIEREYTSSDRRERLI